MLGSTRGFLTKREPAASRGLVLCVLLSSVAIVEFPKWIVLSAKWYGVPAAVLLYLLMAALPFFLARIKPKIADFDKTWLPLAWSHWLLFAGMVCILLLTSHLVILGSRPAPLLFDNDGNPISLGGSVNAVSAPSTVLFRGAVLVLLGPLAEEIFWRGYVLERLRILMRWNLAILIQSALYGLAHLPGLVLCVSGFLYGIILGGWRIRFRSLLPLVVAHIILNGVALVPRLTREYDMAVRSYPRCREIDLLAKEPAETAVPALIAFMADTDESVAVCAVEVLDKSFKSQAEPYLKEALRSQNSRIIEHVLLAIDVGRCRYSSRVVPDVRSIVWEFPDRLVELSATSTLRGLGDEAGLRDIADHHPDEIVRRAAKKMLLWSDVDSELK